MIKPIIHQVKLFLILLLDLLLRIQKYIKFTWFGKHEIERILDSQVDIYEKSMSTDRWLTRSNCETIQAFLERHFGDKSDLKSSKPKQAIDKILSSYCGASPQTNPTKRTTKRRDKLAIGSISNLEDSDLLLGSILEELTEDFYQVIKRTKHLKRLSSDQKDCLRDILYRIVSYKMSAMLAEIIAATRYDADSDEHTNKLMNLWNNLIRADKLRVQYEPYVTKVFPPELLQEIGDKCDIVSNRWSHIGFQGEDPGTDFRGMGVLGLAQLEYLSRKPKALARDLLKRSLNEDHGYPFAIVGINITYNLLNLFKDGSMKHFYYDTGDVLFRNKQRALGLIRTLNDLYVELFLRFDCFWHESKPRNIFEFKSLMERFVNIVRFDLENRSFSLKFIY